MSLEKAIGESGIGNRLEEVQKLRQGEGSYQDQKANVLSRGPVPGLSRFGSCVPLPQFGCG